MNALAAAGSVVAISSFMSDSLRAHADVILPSATFTESFGTYVNATGNWQSAKGVVAPPGDARPAWKIFRVLADELELEGFEYESPEAVTKELQSHCGNIQLTNLTQFDSAPSFTTASNSSLLRAGETPMYATDPIVRRSQPLQKSLDGTQAFVSMAAAQLDSLSAKEGDVINVKQNGASVALPCKLDNDIPEGCVWVPTGIPETAALGSVFGEIEVSKA
jgi:NADH-quinone oxidoreductase subunit G